jgi:outer membrane murein-binding lipoprotein Lpp
MANGEWRMATIPSSATTAFAQRLVGRLRHFTNFVAASPSHDLNAEDDATLRLASRNQATRSGQAMAAKDEVEMREASSKRTFEEEIQSISDECVRDVREICAGVIEKTKQVAEDVKRLNARADRLLLQAEILAEHWRDISELERRLGETARPE